MKSFFSSFIFTILAMTIMIQKKEATITSSIDIIQVILSDQKFISLRDDQQLPVLMIIYNMFDVNHYKRRFLKNRSRFLN